MAYISFQPNDYFNTKLYSGTGAIQTVSGVGFEPSWIWTKSRTNAGNHQVTDQVRGLTKYIRPNANNAEDTKTNAITAVNSDGFVLGADSSNDINASGQTYASWNWKANGQGSSNTDGSINSTYTSANTTSGFSIVSYTGTNATATVGHGLGVAPKMIIWKELGNSNDWCVWHTSLSATQILVLNSTGATASDSNVMGTLPTSSVFSIGQGTRTNRSGGTYVAYCFADVQGYSKFGSYEGNGSTDGSFVYTGFKPAFVIIKGIDSGGSDNWNIIDNKRLGYNANNNRLFSNSTAAENTTSIADILSNGFKLRVSSTDLNADAKTYIYAAFAEEPLVSSNGVPATAR